MAVPLLQAKASASLGEICQGMDGSGIRR